MNTKIKICGIRSLDSALGAIEAGVDLLGFNFIKTSKRFIEISSAQKIISKIRGKIKTVGVFQNETLENVNKIIEFLQLDYVQLHGEETNDYCQKIKTNVIKAFGLESDFDFEQAVTSMKSYKVDYYLLDRKIQGQGETINLTKANKLGEIFPVFFSGGLTVENVHDIIMKVKPYGVDVAGGIETNGKEDINKIKKFIQITKMQINSKSQVPNYK